MKRSKPLVGLNADYRSAKKDAPAFSYVSAGYYDAVVKAGGIPLVLPPIADPADLGRIVDLLDGVLMVGGADLDPPATGSCCIPAFARWKAAAKNSTAC